MLAFFWSIGAAMPLYNVTHIPHPNSGEVNGASAMGINDLGQVVGDYRVWDSAGNLQKAGAFIHSDTTGSVDLPPPSGVVQPWVEGINNAGQVVLYGRITADALDQAYRYTPSVGYQTIGSFGGSIEAKAINNLGQVTGFAETTDGGVRIFRYTDGVGLEDLGPGVGRAINDQGLVAGSDGPNGILVHAFGRIDFGPGRPYEINYAGNVVGETWIVPGHETAFVYMKGQMLILGDADFSAPVLNDINGNREAVGYGFVGQDLHALYWSESTGGLVDLNTMIPEDSGWYLGFATAINEFGQIIGYGAYNGEFAMYRLDPIREPLRSPVVGSWPWIADDTGFNHVAVRNRHAYAPTRRHGLFVFDVTDPATLRPVGVVHLPGTLGQMVFAGNHALVPAEAAGLLVLDISEPSRPRLAGNWVNQGGALSVAVAGKTACATDYGGVLHLIDISDPANPRTVGAYPVGGSAFSVAIAGNHAYVASLNVGVTVLDITDPTAPKLVKVYTFEGGARSVVVAGQRAYVAAAHDTMTILDVSRPQQPRKLGVYNAGDGVVKSVAKKGQYLFLLDDDTGIEMVDVSNPARPIRVGIYKTPTSETRGAAISGGFAYLADTAGLHILDLKQLAVAPRPRIPRPLDIYFPNHRYWGW